MVSEVHRLPQVINADDPPVTFSARWRVAPGRELEFEQVLDGMVREAATYIGHLGVNIFHPTSAAHSEFHIIVKFDALSNLRRWLDSGARLDWLEKAEPFELAPPAVQVLTGLETWFALPGHQPLLAPARYKMWLVSWLAVFPLVVVIRATLGPLFLDHLPLAVQALILSGILVPLMTFVVMPRMTRVFSRWLYPCFHQGEPQEVVVSQGGSTSKRPAK